MVVGGSQCLTRAVVRPASGGLCRSMSQSGGGSLFRPLRPITALHVTDQEFPMTSHRAPSRQRRTVRTRAGGVAVALVATASLSGCGDISIGIGEGEQSPTSAADPTSSDVVTSVETPSETGSVQPPATDSSSGEMASESPAETDAGSPAPTDSPSSSGAAEPTESASGTSTSDAGTTETSGDAPTSTDPSATDDPSASGEPTESGSSDSGQPSESGSSDSAQPTASESGGSSEPTEEAPTTAPEGEPADARGKVVQEPGIPRRGEAFRWESGLVAHVSTGEDFIPSSAAAGIEGYSQFSIFQVTLTNRSHESFRLSDFRIGAQSAGEQGSRVFDSGNGINSLPASDLNPGETTTFPVVFGVRDKQDTVLDVVQAFELSQRVVFLPPKD